MKVRTGRSIRINRVNTLGGRGEVRPGVNDVPILGVGNGVKAWKRGGSGVGIKGVGWVA